MFDRVAAALKTVNLFEAYMGKFKDAKITDDVVFTCLGNSQDLSFLKEVIPVVGDRLKFVSQFSTATTTEQQQQEQQHEQQNPRQTSGSPEIICGDEEQEHYNSETSSSQSATTDTSTQVKTEPSSPEPTSSFSNQNSTTTTIDFESLIRNSYDEALKLYTNNMNDLFSAPELFLSESTLGEKHQENQSKAIEHFSSSYEQYKNSVSQVEIKSEDGETETFSVKMHMENEETFHVKMSDCQDEMDKKFEEYKEKNQLRKSNYFYKAKDFVREAEKIYTEKIEKIIENCTEKRENSYELKLKEKEVNEEIRKYLNDNIKNPHAKPEFINELNEELQKSIKKWFEHNLKLFQQRRDENEMALNRVFDTAKNYYTEQMEKEFNSQNFIEPLKLAEIDKKIFDATLKMCKEKNQSFKLSRSQTTQIESLMKVIYKKYEDKNLLRKPTTSYAIGIDLGTTNSCVAVYRNGKVEVIYNENGNRTTPSFVCVQDDESVFVGDVAKDQSYRNPENTIFDSKRLIGRNFDDEKVQENIKTWSFDVINDKNKPKIQIRVKNPENCAPPTNKKRKTTNSSKIEEVSFKTYHPEEISALLLRKMKKIAEDYLGVDVNDAVITVPALFNDYQRQATRDAGEIAGLNVLRIINEPTAAAIAYNLHRKDELKRNVLVFDLGGGTLDVVVLQILKGEINVKSVHGDNHLGGQDFDTEMIKYCMDSFKQEHNINLARDQDSENSKKKSDSSSRLRRIRNECERQKKVLSSATKTTIVINAIESAPKLLDLHVPFTRALFELLNEKHFSRCLEIVQLALAEAKMSKSEIDDIVLTGGSTRIPKLQQILSDFFDGKKLCKSINPDEAVAEGAAIQACILSGQEKDTDKDGVAGTKLVVNDVTPFSIGIRGIFKEMTGRFNIVIPKNTGVPCENSQIYTSMVGCSRVSIAIYEGEDPVACNNNLLGEFLLENVPTRTDKDMIVGNVKVTMKINVEGILHVRADCITNGVSNEILIKVLHHRMTRKEIENAKAAVNVLMK